MWGVRGGRGVIDRYIHRDGRLRSRNDNSYSRNSLWFALSKVSSVKYVHFLTYCFTNWLRIALERLSQCALTIIKPAKKVFCTV